MATMYRGTTPTNVFHTDVDLTSAEEVYITYKQGNDIKFEFTKDDFVEFTGTEVVVNLTQKQTLLLNDRKNVRIQFRAIYPSGYAIASNIIEVPFNEILKEGEI